MATDEKPPVTSLKRLKKEIDSLKQQSMPVDAKLLLRLLDYVESREKLLKELLIHMNAVENHIVRVTEVLQKMPQVNMGLLTESMQAMVPKMDEISYNIRKMVDYLEMAAGEVEEPAEEGGEPAKAGKEGGAEEPAGTKGKLENIEDQNKALIGALDSLSKQLNEMGSK